MNCAILLTDSLLSRNALVTYLGTVEAGTTLNILSWRRGDGGRDLFNQNLRKFRELKGSAWSKQKTFEKAGSPCEVGHFSRLDWPDRPFRLIFNHNTKLFVTSYRCHSYIHVW